MGCDIDNRKPISLASALRNSLQDAQSTLNSVTNTLLQRVLRHPSLIPGRTSAAFEQESNSKGHGLGNTGSETNHEQALKLQMEVWNQNPSWTDHPPLMKISAPKGTLCHLESTFQIGIPPDAVYDIVTDPENKRVFKNIKEVTYRKVLKEEGHRQLVEVEQLAIWRFLCFSGTMSIRVYVDQDRRTHSLKYHLAKEGFMKKFEGTWEVKPVYVDAPHCGLLQNSESEPSCNRSRIASEIHFQQVLQPILVPPPPISWYIRGITSKQTELVLEDLQAEAKRLREGHERVSEMHYQQGGEEAGEVSPELHSLETSAYSHASSSRRKKRNIGWLRK